jgi:opacity protein-like surface antigen
MQGGTTMKRMLFIVAALASFAIPAIGHAAPPKPGPYVSGFIGITVPQDADVTGFDTGITPPDINDRVEYDPGINIGGTGGYDFGYIRLEGELSYKHAEVSSVSDRVSGDSFIKTDGSIGVFAVMANGFVDLHNDSPVTPYFGGGIGFATLHLDDTFATQRSTGSRVLLYPSDDDTVFAYQAGAGLEIALNRRLSLDLGYRYFATDKANFDDDLETTTNLKYESHNFAVGVRVKF